MHGVIYGALTRTAPDFARPRNCDGPATEAYDKNPKPHPQVRAERLLTELDFARLSRLQGRSLPSGLASVLDAADTLHSREIPADVVTMYSQVELEDLHTGRQRHVTLCYPADAEPSAGFVSVLSPVGSSLLGAKAGSIARWPTPSGEQGAAEIVSILFQPEASGDYTL